MTVADPITCSRRCRLRRWPAAALLWRVSCYTTVDCRRRAVPRAAAGAAPPPRTLRGSARGAPCSGGCSCSCAPGRRSLAAILWEQAVLPQPFTTGAIFGRGAAAAVVVAGAVRGWCCPGQPPTVAAAIVAVLLLSLLSSSCPSAPLFEFSQCTVARAAVAGARYVYPRCRLRTVVLRFPRQCAFRLWEPMHMHGLSATALQRYLLQPSAIW